MVSCPLYSASLYNDVKLDTDHRGRDAINEPCEVRDLLECDLLLVILECEISI